MLKLTLHIILVCNFLYTTYGINVPGLECLSPCSPYDADCIETNTYTSIKNWFVQGYPEYNIKPMNPLRIDKIVFYDADKIYVLKDVNVTNFDKVVLSNFVFDLECHKMSYRQTYTTNAVIGKMYQDCTLLNTKQISVQLENIPLDGSVYIGLDQPKNKPTYMYIAELLKEKIVDSDMNVWTSSKNLCPRLQQLIAGALADSIHEELLERWRLVFDYIPVDQIFGPKCTW